MNKKKISIIIISVLLAVLTLGIVIAVLSMSGKKVAKAENTYEPSYDIFADMEHDAGMNIDGVLDEDAWQNKKWHRNTYLQNTSGTMPVIKTTAFPTEYGLYIASVAEDTNLMNDGQHTMECNSAFEYYIFIPNVGEEIGKDRLEETHLHIDMRGDVHVKEGNKFKRAVVVDGEINSGETKSATLEVFLPWEYLQVDTSKGIPDECRIYPIYRAVLQGEEIATNTIDTKAFLTSLSDLDNYWRFDENGCINGDREDAVVGDAITGFTKTGGWDVSEEANGIVKTIYGTRNNLIYFRDVYTSDFIIEAKMIPVKTKGEVNPKAGFYFLTPEGEKVYAQLIMDEDHVVDSVNGTKNISKYKLTTYDSFTDKGKWHLDNYKENKNAKKAEGVKFTAVKYGGNFWYFADNEFLGVQSVENMDTKVFPALYAYSMDTIFKDYSCKELDFDGVKSFLNEHGIYVIDAKVASAGGKVTSSKISIKKGEKYDITVTCNSGYEVSSILINGKEKIEDAKKKANAGVYTITAGDGNQEIRVKFKKCDGYQLLGNVASGDKKLSANLLITGITNKILRYEVSAAGEKGYTVTLPKGKYNVYVETDDYIPTNSTITVSKNTVKNFVLKPSIFAKTVSINGKTIQSNMDVWDLSQLENHIIKGSYDMGSNGQPMYFKATGNTALMQTKVAYTTDFSGGFNSDTHQVDLFARLMVSDGTNTGYIGIRNNDVIYTGYTEIADIIPHFVLRPNWDPHLEVQFDVALKDGYFHLYVDGIFILKLEVSKVVPGATAKTNLAFGIDIRSDKKADYEFRNTTFTTDSKKVAAYIKDNVEPETLFTRIVTINNKKLSSAYEQWDTSKLEKNILKGSYAMGSNGKPMYFKATGNTALMQTNVAYTTDFSKGFDNAYQVDLFARLIVTDGTNQGYIGIRNNAAIYTGYKLIDNALPCYVLRPQLEGALADAQFDIVLKDGYFYLHVENVFISKFKVADIVPGATKDTQFAFGLDMRPDKPADFEFSNIQFTTDISKVNAYMEKNPEPIPEPLPDNNLFGETVTVNGKELKSSHNKWDTSKLANNILSGSFAMGSNNAPMYFKATGKTALMQTEVEYTTDFPNGFDSAYQVDLFARLIVTDGTNQGYIGIRNNDVHYTGAKEFANVLPGFVLRPQLEGSLPDVQFDVALKDGYIYLYVENVFIHKFEVSAIVPGATKDTILAFGLDMRPDKAADYEFRNIQFTTDVSKVDVYLTPETEPEPTPDNSLFAKKLTINSKELTSAYDKWDTSEIEDNILKGSLGLGSNGQPMYFKATGNAALLQTKVKYTTDFSGGEDTTNYQLLIKPRLIVTDGTNNETNYYYIMLHSNDVRLTGYDMSSTTDVISYHVLRQGFGHMEIQFDVALKDGYFYLYIDQVFVTKIEISKVVPNATKDTQLAYGIDVHLDDNTRNADYEFSGIQFTTDASKVDAYLTPETEPEGTLFTNKVTIGGKEFTSALDKWDTSALGNNKLIGTQNSSKQTLYFKETGTAALLQATVDYTKGFSADSYPLYIRPRLIVTDGASTECYNIRIQSNDVYANNSGKKYEDTLAYHVLRRGFGHPTIQFDVALKGENFYVYVDNVLVTTIPKSEVVPNATANTQLAFGIDVSVYGAEAGEPAMTATEYEITNIQFSTDVSTVDAYLTPETKPEGTLFANKVTIGGKEFTSALDKWDTSALGNNKLIGTQNSSKQTLYFKEIGIAALLQATVDYTKGFSADSYPLYIRPRLIVTDGASTECYNIRIQSNDVYANNSGKKYEDTLAYHVLRRGFGHPTIQFDVALKGENFYVYIDNVLVATIAKSEVVPNATANTPLAFGIDVSVYGAEAGEPAMTATEYEITNIQFSTDADKVNAYLQPFAEKVTVNGKELTSAYDKWDTSELANNVLKGSYALGSNGQPMYLKTTGNVALLQTEVAYTTDFSDGFDSTTHQVDLFARFMVSDGTNTGYIGIRNNDVYYTGYTEIKDALPHFVLRPNYDPHLEVQVDIAVKEGYLYLYVDTVYVTRLEISKIVTGATKDTQLAFGLDMRPDKASDFEFRNIQFTTDVNKVDEYLN